MIARLTKRLSTASPLLILSLAGCAATMTVAPPTAAPQEKAAPDSEQKLDEAEHKLEIARDKLEVAVLEAAAFDAKHEVRVRHAQAEVAMAEAKLATFREVRKPNRMASETLNLQVAKDRAQEAADELAQVEIMYAEQDLNDMTREFVIQRERRNAERAGARIEIQEADFAAVEERELPLEEQQLSLALDKASTGLSDAEREGEIGRKQKQIAVKQAENEVHKLELELTKLKDEPEGAAGDGSGGGEK